MENNNPIRHRRKPAIFYGWGIVAVSFITLSLAYGTRYSFPIFYVAILNDFHWSRASTAIIFSLNLAIYGFSAPLAGTLVDRLGPRKVLALGALLMAVGLAACSLSQSIWHFLLLFGIVTAFGHSMNGYTPHYVVLQNWFISKRATAIGLASAGSGLGMLWAALNAIVIENFGWRTAYLVLGIIVAVIILPLVLLFQRARPQEKGLLPDGTSQPVESVLAAKKPAADNVLDKHWATQDWNLPRAFKTYRLWCLFLMCFFHGIGVNLMMAHQVAFATGVGFTTIFAASVFGFYGIMQAIGSASGFMADMMRREKFYGLIILGALLSMAALLYISDTSQVWLLYLYSIGFGLFLGAILPVQVASIADIFQGAHFGSILGITTLGYGIGGAIGPWLGGYIFDKMGNYIPAFALSMLSMLAGYVLLLIAAPRKIRRVGRAKP